MRLVILLCAALLSSSLFAAPHQLTDSSYALDLQLEATLQSLFDGNLSEARVLARQAARRFPDSALAQLLAAELTATAAHKDVMAGSSTTPELPLASLLQEAQARLQQHDKSWTNATNEQLPSEVIQLGKDLSALLVVDLEQSSLRHLAVSDGISTLIRQHYIGSGKAGYGKRYEGDNRTPLGIYGINGQRSDASLPDLYGSGALTLTYPNALDRHLGRTGSGIWLHGVPHSQRSRAPRSSEGCVTMSNDHFSVLQRNIMPDQATAGSLFNHHIRSEKPLVLLTHNTEWVDAQQQNEEQTIFQGLFSRYQQAWQQQDKAELTSLYASPETALKQLASLAGRDDAQSPFPSAVNKEDISIFRNPVLNDDDEQWNRHFVSMHMQYGASDEYQLTLYWGQNEQGQWQIVTEQWNALNT